MKNHVAVGAGRKPTILWQHNLYIYRNKLILFTSQNYYITTTKHCTPRFGRPLKPTTFAENELQSCKIAHKYRRSSQPIATIHYNSPQLTSLLQSSTITGQHKRHQSQPLQSGKVRKSNVRSQKED